MKKQLIAGCMIVLLGTTGCALSSKTKQELLTIKSQNEKILHQNQEILVKMKQEQQKIFMERLKMEAAQRQIERAAENAENAAKQTAILLEEMKRLSDQTLNHVSKRR